MQEEQNSRAGYAGMDTGEDYNFLLSQQESHFIQERDAHKTVDNVQRFYSAHIASDFVRQVWCGKPILSQYNDACHWLSIYCTLQQNH